tara:strand:- start:110 stop:766 length:657 start_codon:yes stop_codon:yes gene_type:complete
MIEEDEPESLRRIRDHVENVIYRIKRYSDPWNHYIIDNFFSNEIYNLLQDHFKISSKKIYTNNDGTRNHIEKRTFLTNDYAIKYNLEIIPNYIIDNLLFFEKEFNIDLSNPGLRIELIQDVNGFWQKPHLDKLDKRITIIINIDKDDSNNLGSSLYKDELGSNEQQIKWKNNSALVFVPTEYTWHGLKKIDFVGERKIVIINIPDINFWRLKDTLWIK